MLHDSESPVGRACQRRYSAWTLYARAFCGNRADADDIVRTAVNRTLRLSDDLRSERQAHERVLGAIRTEVLGLLKRRQGVNADLGAAPGSVQPSVLKLLTDDGSKTDPRHAGDLASQMLQELPRPQRRAIQMLLTRRPGMPLLDVARKRRVEVGAMSEEIEEGIDLLAAGLRAAPARTYDGGHPDLKSLTGYIDGALSGDEARAVVGHCAACSGCGDRLGTMMLLRSQAAKTARKPLVSRGIRAAALVMTLTAGLTGGFLLARALAPNPWAEHATVETVPRWFHDFLYGYREDVSPRDMALAEGLDLLVRGELDGAIAKLEPLTVEPGREPEASAYLGIAKYLAGDVSGRTVDLLATGTSSTRAGRISDWYLANTLLARGEIREARHRLSGLAFVGDWVGRQSEALLQRLDAAEQPERAVIG